MKFKIKPPFNPCDWHSHLAVKPVTVEGYRVLLERVERRWNPELRVDGITRGGWEYRLPVTASPTTAH